jgi:hypothetical protein
MKVLPGSAYITGKNRDGLTFTLNVPTSGVVGT